MLGLVTMTLDGEPYEFYGDITFMGLLDLVRCDPRRARVQELRRYCEARCTEQTYAAEWRETLRKLASFIVRARRKVKTWAVEYVQSSALEMS